MALNHTNPGAQPHDSAPGPVALNRTTPGPQDRQYSSALKHGLGEPEILHAYRNPVRIWDLGDGFTMIVGPNQSAIFLEVGYVDGDQVHVIVHAMKAREKFLR